MLHTPFKLPLTVGTPQGGNAAFVFDAAGEPVMIPSGIPGAVDVATVRADEALAEAVARADFAVAAINERAELLKVLSTVAAIAAMTGHGDKALVDAITKAQQLLARAGV